MLIKVDVDTKQMTIAQSSNLGTRLVDMRSLFEGVFLGKSDSKDSGRRLTATWEGCQLGAVVEEMLEEANQSLDRGFRQPRSCEKLCMTIFEQLHFGVESRPLRTVR